MLYNETIKELFYFLLDFLTLFLLELLGLFLLELFLLVLLRLFLLELFLTLFLLGLLEVFLLDFLTLFLLGGGGSLPQTGGNSSIRLTVGQLPAHSYSYGIPSGGALEIDGAVNNGRYNLTQKRDTSSIGNNESINILPPYYALCYIIKI